MAAAFCAAASACLMALPLAVMPASAAAPTGCQVQADGTRRQVATSADLTAALGRTVTLAWSKINSVLPPQSGDHSDAPGSAAGCEWIGAPVTNPFSKYDVLIDVSIVPWPTARTAQDQFQQGRTAWPTADVSDVSGVGDAAYLITPQDCNAQLAVLAGRYDISVSLCAAPDVLATSPWVAVARVIVANLAPIAPVVQVPTCRPGQLPDVGAPCTAASSPPLTICPTGQGSDIALPGSRFAAATEASSSFAYGGIYAHIYPAPACADPTSNPPTSSWVMLQAPHDAPHVFAQAGIFYGSSGQRPGIEHPFAEVDYPQRPDTTNGTVEFGFPVNEGTFTVQVYAKSNQSIPIACEGGVHIGGCTTNDTQEIRFTLNGTPLIAAFIPSKYAADLTWANLAAEIHTTWSRIPGYCSQDLLFADAHVYIAGGWQQWNPSVSELDFPNTMGQQVWPGSMDVWARGPEC